MPAESGSSGVGLPLMSFAVPGIEFGSVINAILVSCKARCFRHSRSFPHIHATPPVICTKQLPAGPLGSQASGYRDFFVSNNLRQRCSHSWSHQDTAPCRPALGTGPVFLAAISFACFLHSTGISISLWPDAALRGFLIDFFGAQRSIQSHPLELGRAGLASEPRSRQGSGRQSHIDNFRIVCRCCRFEEGDFLFDAVR